MHVLPLRCTGAPRWPKAPKCTQHGSQNRLFWDRYSMNYAMLKDISSMTNNKLSNRNHIVPTSSKKTHTTQRGVGGMRRRPGKFGPLDDPTEPPHHHHAYFDCPWGHKTTNMQLLRTSRLVLDFPLKFAPYIELEKNPPTLEACENTCFQIGGAFL